MVVCNQQTPVDLLMGYSSAVCDPANGSGYMGSPGVPLFESKLNYIEAENSVSSL